MLTLSEPVTVAGTPTLALNNGGTATYAGGSGGDILTFKYTVGLTDSTVSALAVTAIGLLNGAEIKDIAGNTANLSGALTTFSGLHVDPPVPPVSPAWNNPGSSNLLTTPVAPRTIAVHLSADEYKGLPEVEFNRGQRRQALVARRHLRSQRGARPSWPGHQPLGPARWGSMRPTITLAPVLLLRST